MESFVSVNEGDNCFEITGQIGLVRNILTGKSDNSCDGRVMFEEFASFESFYKDPLFSTDFSVFYASKMTGVHKVYLLSEINLKYLRIPFKNGFILMRQLHLWIVDIYFFDFMLHKSLLSE